MANPFSNLMELPIHYSKASSQYRRLARERYVRIQEGKCWHCKNPLDGDPSLGIMRAYIDPRPFPPGFFDHPVHLHHNHETDLTIGAVHARCNAWLWNYKGE